MSKIHNTKSRSIPRHGGRYKPEYESWVGAIGRCENKKHARYRDYGGRGIKICERWRKSFAAFFADMGPKPSRKHSLDRINNDGDYCPENCRWATMKEQGLNTRHNHWITHDGLTLTLGQWAERTGILRMTINNRLRTGWSVADALSIPAKRSGPKLYWKGKRR